MVEGHGIVSENRPTGRPEEPEDMGGEARPASTRLGRRWVFEVAYAALVVAAAALILSVVGRRSGWPVGQAFNNEFILVSLYAAHFRHLDLFPVWSSSDALGLGTPVLLFYQKAFFYVAGAIYLLLGGAMKTTLIVTVALFLVVGAYGMRRALGTVTESRLLCAVGSVGFLFTNYVFTDWLVRGDLPEFSAMMIVPWLLFWCLDLVKNRHVSLLLIPVLPLLVDAHSAIGLISVFTLVVAMGTFLAVAGISGLRRIALRLMVAVGGATVLLAPTLLAELQFSQYFDPATKVSYYAEVFDDVVSFGSYFSAGPYRWLSENAPLNLQIDYAIWVPIALGLVGVVAWRIATGRPRGTDVARSFDLPTLAFLVISATVYLLLQLRAFLWVYRVMVPLQAIDYPYRMLTFIIPIGVILVVVLADAAFRAFPTSWVPRVCAGAWLVALVLLSPVTSTWTTVYGVAAKPGTFPSLALSKPPNRVDYRTFRGFFAFNRLLYLEYLPKVYTASGAELGSDGTLYTRLHQHQSGAASLSDVPCTVLAPTNVPLESLSLTFEVTCAGATRVALPVTINAFSSVFIAGGDGKLRQIPYFHRRTDPRMIIDMSGSTPETVVVHLPTLWGVLSQI
jgi:hypothetical protein